MGGGTERSLFYHALSNGLSPRGRGNQLGPFRVFDLERSIPAWAGEPDNRTPGRFGLQVYPRVGGGTALEVGQSRLSQGLSPRGRGNPPPQPPPPHHQRSIPAWAGEPSTPATRRILLPVYPRVGGGTEPMGPEALFLTGLSPRGRGNPVCTNQPSRMERSIPAWAGEPRGQRGNLRRGAVYPRVGGGTRLLPGKLAGVFGLSPRGRGNRFLDHIRQTQARSIPAWAGEPSAQEPAFS